MSSLDDELLLLEAAMRTFFQTIKRGQHWAHVTAKAGIVIDRPSGAILQLLLADDKPWHVHDLASSLGIEAPSVTRKTQELQQAGLVRRVPNSQDRRAVDIRITPAGRKTAMRIGAANRQLIGEAVAHWPARDRQHFIALFQRFSNDLQTNNSERKDS